MKMIASIIFLALLAAAPLQTRAADEPPALSHNPFSRPPSAIIRPPRIEVDNGGSAEQRLPLQATMVGRVNRLANVGGRILKPGDDYEGYNLVAIHEQYAVFERDGNRVDVYVKPGRTQDDD